MAGLWPWLTLAGLGAFHGLNPAMGWLFAVALGQYRQSRRVVLLSLLPIAVGHAIAIALVVAAVVGLELVIERLDEAGAEALNARLAGCWDDFRERLGAVMVAAATLEAVLLHNRVYAACHGQIRFHQCK